MVMRRTRRRMVVMMAVVVVVRMVMMMASQTGGWPAIVRHVKSALALSNGVNPRFSTPKPNIRCRIFSTNCTRNADSCF
eukprot:3168098-Rhodomonas_salina.1